MTPRFSASVDPIFLYVLHLLQRIESGALPDAQQERLHLRGQFDRAEAALGSAADWNLAKYALAAWIDETLITLPWNGSEWWKENPLEFELFRTADAFTEFFERSRQAAESANKDALEVFYVCVVLGFRGVYQDIQDPTTAMQIEQMGLPPSLQEWATKSRAQIRYGQGRPPIRAEPRPGEGAPPLEAKFEFLAALVLLGILGVLAFFVRSELFVKLVSVVRGWF